MGGKPVGRFLVCLLRLGFLSSLSFFGFAEPVAFSVGLDELHAVGKSIDERAGEPFVAEDLGPVLEGPVGGEDKALTFVGAADDVEEKFGSGFGEGQDSQPSNTRRCSAFGRDILSSSWRF